MAELRFDFYRAEGTKEDRRKHKRKGFELVGGESQCKVN